MNTFGSANNNLHNNNTVESSLCMEAGVVCTHWSCDRIVVLVVACVVVGYLYTYAMATCVATSTYCKQKEVYTHTYTPLCAIAWAHK